MNDYERRLHRLERNNRILTVALLSFVALALMGQTPKPRKAPPPPPPTPPKVVIPQELTIQKLRLVDAQGRPRANFFVDNDEVYLILGESNGKTRLAFRVKDQGDASMVLAGSAGEPRASLQCSSDGTVRRVP